MFTKFCYLKRMFCFFVNFALWWKYLTGSIKIFFSVTHNGKTQLKDEDNSLCANKCRFFSFIQICISKVEKKKFRDCVDFKLFRTKLIPSKGESLIVFVSFFSIIIIVIVNIRDWAQANKGNDLIGFRSFLFYYYHCYYYSAAVKRSNLTTWTYCKVK